MVIARCYENPAKCVTLYMAHFAHTRPIKQFRWAHGPNCNALQCMYECLTACWGAHIEACKHGCIYWCLRWESTGVQLSQGVISIESVENKPDFAIQAFASHKDLTYKDILVLPFQCNGILH